MELNDVTDINLYKFPAWSKKKKYEIILPRVQSIEKKPKNSCKTRLWSTPQKKNIYKLRSGLVSPNPTFDRTIRLKDSDMLNFLFRNKQKVTII